MTPGLQKLLALCGLAFVVLGMPGFVMSGLFPPISPSMTPAEVAAHWQNDSGTKRVGLIILLAVSGLPIPFGALIAIRMKPLEGRHTPLAYIQVVSAGISVMGLILPCFALMAASYRPERNPEITQALTDLGWLPLVMFFPAAVLQAMALGFAIFNYRGPTPIFPRWFGYFNFWCGFLFAGGAVALLFKDGIFAWNGIVGYWIVIVIFGAWYQVIFWQLWKTMDFQSADDEAPADVVPSVGSSS